MEPQELTNVSLLGFCITVLGGILVLTLPRRLAVIPLIITACFVTLGQRVNILGLNFNLLRIAILFGWIRIIFRRELRLIKTNSIDWAIIIWTLSSIVAYSLLNGSVDSFVSSLGPAYNAVGTYFLLRCLIRSEEDIKTVVYIIAIIIVPLALFMLLERSTGRNIFSVFGGVPEFTMIRDGNLRCQGPFRHPILAGTFGSTLIPLFAAMWLSTGSRRTILTGGLLGAIIIIVASVSSGPLMALGAGLLWMVLWKLRAEINAVYGMCFVALFGLHMVMKAPVWFLIGRIGNVIGGTAWHRSELIDQAVKHFGEWWVLGTTYTAHWTIDNGLITLPGDPNMVDITNQYIFIGVNGGIVPLFLFMLIIYFGFREVGRRVNEANRIGRPERLLIWGMGGTVLAHVTSFISVVYFDQMVVFWYLSLAMISCISERFLMKGSKYDREAIFEKDDI